MALKSETTTLATIQMRRGREEDFDPHQMTAGEWAVSTDSKKVWMCFAPGLVLRMATYEAFEKDMEEIRRILVEAQDIQLAIQTWYKLSESYAHGGTGTREGEDTDNAKYYADQAKISADNAEAVSGVGIMTVDKAGIGKPDGTTITADEDGTLRVIGSGGAEGGFASKAIYGDNAVSLGRKEETTIGEMSFAFGEGVEASATRSFSCGRETKAINNNSHAEGAYTTASGSSSHAEGFSTIASIDNSHAEGNTTTASGHDSHSEGNTTIAEGNQAHAEGYGTKATGSQSHAEGNGTTASGKKSHAGGTSSTASGSNSFAHGNMVSSIGMSSFSCGESTVAKGNYSFCEGYETIAEKSYSHAGGIGTTALTRQYSIGTYNDISNISTSNQISGASSQTAFCIGNGNSSTPSNAARIDYNGKLWCKQAYSSTGADYAELFEWADGNTDNEDRRGYFVTVDGKKIKKARAGDYILGIISGNPSVIGNTDMEWYGQFMRDEFGTFIKENHKETITEPVIDKDGNVTEEEKEVDVEFYKVNPDYDPDAPYTFRLDRPEWDAVGMLGVLPVRDDGTCEVGKFCKCADGGIATLATERGFDTYMVIERVTENVVSVVFK